MYVHVLVKNYVLIYLHTYIFICTYTYTILVTCTSYKFLCSHLHKFQILFDCFPQLKFDDWVVALKMHVFH